MTSLIFLNSDKLGTQYRNDMFVSGVHNGRIYHFKLNSDRTELILPNSIQSGRGFGGITDLTVGPDRYLYAISIGQGKIFKILPD